MKKILSTLLAATMLVGTLTLGALSVSGAELELQPAEKAANGQLSSTGGCGFIDANLYFTTSLNVEKLEDITVEVNGKPAYWNIGYMGYKHCALNNANDLEKSWIQLGIVGAALTADDQNTLTITAGTDTYTQTFTSTAAAKGVAYSKVVADKDAKTVEATIIYNEAPGYKVGDELEGKCHDDHNNTTTFKVTAVDGNTVTLKAEGYVPNQSLLELKDEAGVLTTVTINTVKINQFVGDKKVTEEATKINITEASANRGEGSSLIDGTDKKLECAIPSDTDPVTVTFKTETAVKPDYLVIYTGNDDSEWINRAPNAFKLYGVTADGTETLILEKTESGIQNVNYTPFAFEVTNKDTAYDTFKLVITSRISLEQLDGQRYNDWFQIGEIELYTGSVTVTDADRYVDSVLTGAVEYNGTAPAAPDGTTAAPSSTSAAPAGTTAAPAGTTAAPAGTTAAPAGTTAAPAGTSAAPAGTTAAPTTTQGSGSGSGSGAPATGDIAVVLSGIALIAVIGAVVVAKKRKIED